MRDKRNYVRIAWVYDLLDLPFEYGRYRSIRRTLFQDVGGTVLDAGVGTGCNMAFYPSTGQVMGIDLSRHMLARAEKRRASLGIAAELRQADVKSTGLPDATFDYVIATFLFCVLEEEDQLLALRELRRVCKPAGELRIVEYTYSQNPLRRFVMHMWAPWVRLMYGAAFDRHTERYVTSAGFDLVEECYMYKDIIKLLVLRPR